VNKLQSITMMLVASSVILLGIGSLLDTFKFWQVNSSIESLKQRMERVEQAEFRKPAEATP